MGSTWGGGRIDPYYKNRCSRSRCGELRLDRRPGAGTQVYLPFLPTSTGYRALCGAIAASAPHQQAVGKGWGIFRVEDQEGQIQESQAPGCPHPLDWIWVDGADGVRDNLCVHPEPG